MLRGMPVLRGSCHCGNIEVQLETKTAPRDLRLRACDCTFCRKHGVRSVMDPDGHAIISVGDAAGMSPYQFGLRTAEFLVCRTCGVYAGAVLHEGDSAWAVLNANLLDDQHALPREAQASSYGSEDAQGRITRRKQQWTPATVSIKR